MLGMLKMSVRYLMNKKWTERNTTLEKQVKRFKNVSSRIGFFLLEYYKYYFFLYNLLYSDSNVMSRAGISHS